MKKVILLGLLALVVTLVPGCSCGGGGGALKDIRQNLTAIQDQLSQMENSTDSLGQRITALEAEGASPAPTTEYYLGFMPAKAGQWADWVIVCPQLYTMRIECIGKETINGKECMGFEVSGRSKNLETGSPTDVLLQLWRDVDTGELVNAVAEIDDMPGLHCLSLNQVKALLPQEFWPSLGGDKTPAEVLPTSGYTLAKFPREVYPQFTGFEHGELDTARFRLPDGSVRFVSSQIPFGWAYCADSAAVKDIIEHLFSYGFTGAERSITAMERDNCMELSPEALADYIPLICRCKDIRW